MPNSINEKLREIAENSALKQALTPIFICDENLMLCAKSIGAAEHVKRPPVRSSLADHFDSITLESLYSSDDGAVIAQYHQSIGDTRVIITHGIVAEQKYYAIVFEPQICFCPTPEPWYVLSACGRLRCSIHELLLSPPQNTSKLKRDCTRIARLCDYSTADGHGYTDYRSSHILINRAVNSIINEATPHVDTIGGALDVYLNDTEFLAVPYSPHEIFCLISTLLFTALLISDNNRVSIKCETESTNMGIIDLSFTVIRPRSEFKNTTAFDELVKTVSPITLELAALSDMMNRLNVDVYCKSYEKELCLGCFLPVKAQTRLEVEKPSSYTGQNYAKTITEHLFVIAESQLKRNKN